MARPPKGAVEKPAPKAKARVLTNASIRDFVEAVMRNLNEKYWEDGQAILDGNVSREKFEASIAYINGIRDAGEIMRKTLAEDIEDEDGDTDKDEGTVGARSKRAR